MEVHGDKGVSSKVSRWVFPQDFVFGTASSAYQYEGAAHEGGRGPSTWDHFTQRTPGKVKNGCNGNVAIDSYHRFKEDVGIMKKMGFDAYRFSISWPRILPGGKLSGGVNKEGIKYYNDLIDELLAKGKIGITLVSQWWEPLDEDNDQDVEAAFRAQDFMFGWFMEPLITGDYPAKMKKLVGCRLPEFSPEQSKLVKGSYDFLGLNYYTASYAFNVAPDPHKKTYSYSTDSHIEFTAERNGIPIGPKGGSDKLYGYPEGLSKLLLYIKKAYNKYGTLPPIYITENGYDEKDNSSLTLSEALVDQMRIDYHNDHLFYIQQAVKYPKESAIWFANFLRKVTQTKASNKPRLDQQRQEKE
ncbi:unnamed protein product [Ilex paraguariensis]|uniref:Uncharacterized protein n=1 Tax=Ilex paraguariensis TaxID=185542 RepID=A0ABC8QQF3_9AQUA